MGNARFYCCFISTIYTLHKFVPNTHHGTHHHLRVDTLKQDYFWLFRTVPRGGPHCSCHFIIIHRLPILTVKPNGGESCARVPAFHHLRNATSTSLLANLSHHHPIPHSHRIPISRHRTQGADCGWLRGGQKSCEQ